MLSPWSGDQRNVWAVAEEGRTHSQPHISPPSKSHSSLTAQGRKRKGVKELEGFTKRGGEEEESLTAVELIQAVRAVLSEVTHFLNSDTLAMRLAGKHSIWASVRLDGRCLRGHRGRCGVLFGKLSYNGQTRLLTEQKKPHRDRSKR